MLCGNSLGRILWRFVESLGFLDVEAQRYIEIVRGGENQVAAREMLKLPISLA